MINSIYDGWPFSAISCYDYYLTKFNHLVLFVNRETSLEDKYSIQSYDFVFLIWECVLLIIRFERKGEIKSVWTFFLRV